MNLYKNIVSIIIACSMIIPTVPVLAANTEENTVTFESSDVMFADGFECNTGKTDMLITGYASPQNWEFEDSRNPIDSVLVCGVTNKEKATGEASLAVQAVERNSAGYMTPKLRISNETPGLDMSVKVKNSQDYKDNKATFVLYFYCGDYMVHRTVGSDLTTSKNNWNENVIHIDYTMYPDYGVKFDSVRIKLVTTYIGKNNVPGTGMLYFDDFLVVKSYDDPYIIRDIRADKLSAWYVLGETVTFKPEKDLPASVREIRATVHNPYGEVIYENTISSEKFQSEGWVYTPEEIGFYKVGFKGITDYGEIALVSAYRNGTKKVGTFVIEERSFAVAHETKPMEERNQNLTYASNNPGGIFMNDFPNNWDFIFELHDIIGFSGVRLHAFAWEPDLGAITPPNPGKGLYNWTSIDKIFENLTKYDFNVWACVLLTPEWASTHAGDFSTPSAKVQTLKSYKMSMPTRVEYYTEYLSQVAKRYGDVIDEWEVWCETTPRCAYFKNATAEDYAYLLKTSYNHLKNIQPDDQVFMAGMIRNNADYYADILDAGIYDYTDAILIHQRWPDYENYYAEEEKRGLGGKPWINGEAHYNLLSTEYGFQKFTDQEEAFDMLTGYFWDIRENVEKIALFQVDTAYDVECLEFKKSIGERALSYGLWRRRPFPEPKLVAVVVHTFFEEMGKDFRYVDEYSFDNEVKAMRFSNDGEPWVAVWKEYGDAQFPEEIRNCMTENTKIIDWEGKEVSINDTMRQRTIYMIKGLDETALDSIQAAEESVLVSRRVRMDDISDLVVEGNKNQIFDEVTFAESNNINWIENTGWSWRAKSNNAEQENYNARFAVSANEKGIYLMIEADDNTPFFENDQPSQLYNTDSVQIGIDVTGERYADMRVEVDVANTTDGIVVYKRAAADIFGSIPTGWNAGDTVISSEYARVEVKQGKILYKIFIPASELFPYDFNLLDNQLKMAIALNDNDGKVRRGQLLWADGIDGGKHVGKYGTVILP